MNISADQKDDTKTKVFATFHDFQSFDFPRNLAPTYICEEKSIKAFFDYDRKYFDEKKYRKKEFKFNNGAAGYFMMDLKRGALYSVVFAKDLKSCLGATTSHLQKLTKTKVK